MGYSYRQKMQSPYTAASLTMKPAGAIYIMQDALTQLHAQEKCGNKEMKENYDCFWVVSKNKVTFFRYPDWHETVDVSVCSADAGRICTESQVTVTDSEGRLCVSGRQELCVLDFARHRLQRLESVGFVPEMPPLSSAGYERFHFEGLTEHHSQVVLPHMVDMSSHMNNVEYVKVALDCFDSAFCKDKEPEWLESHYLKECKEGETLSVQCISEGDISCVRLSREGVPVFEMKVKWRDKHE